MMASDSPLEIGSAFPRQDAVAKVLGREKFAADYYDQNPLWAGVKRAGIPHGRLKAIHTEAALTVPGVVCVLTHRDIRGSNRQGVVRKDQPVLVDSKVRHCGDPVALVVAETKEALERALRRIALDIKVLPAVSDILEALDAKSPRIHEDHENGNLLLHGTLEKGRVEQAFQECAHRVEAWFHLPWQEHAYLETEAGWAVLQKDGEVTLVASTQTPFRDRAEVADALGLDLHKVRIVAPFCGGAFGGKDGITVQSLLALAAIHCPGRAVKMWWDREESFIAGAKRHRAMIYYRAGATASGVLHALEAKLYYDTGAYDHLGGVVMALGLEHAGGPYRIPHSRIQAFSVYTNNPVSGAFRGFGVPQVNGALEQIMDMLAEAAGQAPVAFRRRHAVRRGDINAIGVTVQGSTGIQACLDTLVESASWKAMKAFKAREIPFKRRGVGIACVMHGMGYGPVVPDVAHAKIELQTSGQFCVFCGVVDMGQGNAATCLQIAGHILNQDMPRMALVLPDTQKTLPCGSSSASRTTYTYGNALIAAACALKKRILQYAGELWMVPDEKEVLLVPGAVRHLPSGREMALADLAKGLNPSERVATARFRAPVSREMPVKDPALRLHGIPHVIFSYGVHAAGVEVDTLTGQVQVKKYMAVSDCGRILNPQLIRQQIEGAIAQGIGYALQEAVIVERGVMKTKDFSTYILPCALDVPEMETAYVELEEDSGPFGMKGAGEVGMDGPLPAIGNAVADAIGARIFHYPLTPERVLAAMDPNEKTGQKG